MRKWSCFVIIGLSFVLATSAFADREVVIERLGDVLPQTTGQAGVATLDCLVGNQNAAAWAITDWVWGEEAYKFSFNPANQNCGCTEGFQVEMVHMLLQFGAEDVPATFDAYVDAEEAIWDDVAGCFLPGPEYCVSSTFTITIDAPGLYDIALPITCECAFMDYQYMISFHIPTAFTVGNPDLITDNAPIGCVSWNDYGAGWLDLIDFGFPGEVMMWADVACCGQPVAVEEASWGKVKSLFR